MSDQSGSNESCEDRESSRDEFIVQGADVKTDAFAAVINARPTIALVTKVANDVVVLRATENDVNELKAKFTGLIIEPNEELRLDDVPD